MYIVLVWCHRTLWFSCYLTQEAGIVEIASVLLTKHSVPYAHVENACLTLLIITLKKFNILAKNSLKCLYFDMIDNFQ